jgi:3-hydroxybutyryl-CoA dehydratase
VSAIDFSASFEDLRLGQGFRSRGRTVTEADVVGFAALTGDWHPQHADAHWAAGSIFGERIAHGMLILSFAVGLVPFDPDRVLALRRIADVVFKRAVTLGQTIRVEGEIGELRELDERAGLVAWRWTVRNQDEALVCRARVELLWRSGPLDATDAEDRLARASRPQPLGSPAGAAPIDFPAGVVPC